jgi:hypothetical protein
MQVLKDLSLCISIIASLNSPTKTNLILRFLVAND